MNYKKEYSRILKNLEKWNKELKKLQETCPHEDISGHCNFNLVHDWVPVYIQCLWIYQFY